MKFTKALIAPAALVLAVAGLASCGKEDDRTHVVFWSNVYGDREEAWRDQVVADFEAAHKDIHVEVIGAGRYWEINEKVQANLTTPKKLPNMVVGYPDYFTNYMDKLVDLTDLFDDETIGFGKTTAEDGTVVEDPKTKKEDLVTKYLEEGSNYAKQGIYSLPFGKTTEVMFTNDVVLEELNLQVPTTWAEAVNVATKMLEAHPERYTFEKEGKEIVGAYAPINFHSTSNLYITFSAMMGVPYASNVDANKDGKLSKEEAVLFNNTRAKSMVKQLKQLFDQKIFTTKDVTSKIGASEYVEDDFVKENPSTILMYDTTKGTSYAANIINKVQNEGKKNEFVGANHIGSAHSVLNVGLTGLDSVSEKAMAINQGGSIAFFDKGEKENRAAFEFYKFMTNTDNSAAYSVANSTTPMRKSAFETEGVKNIINGKNTEVTTEKGWVEQFAKMNGEVFDLYKSYDVNNQLVVAPVNVFSAGQRTAVENMLINILIATPADEAALDKLIDDQFKAAYDAI